MKAAPLLVNWHTDKEGANSPVYSAHFEPHGRGRLATAGGDSNIRLWQVEEDDQERKVTYLATLSKHTQAVNVVRWSPKGEVIASASDDGNVLMWIPSETAMPQFGEEHSEDKEHWVVRRICRSNSASEVVYDLAWSPDGAFFITGSMDNIARIYDASTGAVIRQIAEHNHYVQGVAWDPLNEFLATQSSDRSVHVYSLVQSDGQFSLTTHGKMSKMDLPARRRTSNSPAPPDFSHQRGRHGSESSSFIAGSPGHSAPGTPASLAPPMNPPPLTSHSRRSSMNTGAGSPMLRRSASPAPSMPLPAVMPGASPKPSHFRNANIYANESLVSFFRRLTFSPDGSLLFTPAGQYKKLSPTSSDPSKATDDVINTVYIYSRAGLNKPPIAHLPGHKKPSIAVKCSPVVYNHRLPVDTKEMAIDTSSKSEDITPLPGPVLGAKQTPKTTTMDPPPSVPSPAPSNVPESPKAAEGDVKSPDLPQGPLPAFNLPYRMVYAVATQDAVFVYDTQQQTPILIVSNLHLATFTDLTWSEDGLTLIMASNDGFCSAIAFAPGELGSVYRGSLSTRVQQPSGIMTAASAHATPLSTPTHSSVTSAIKRTSSTGLGSPSTAGPIVRPASPTRSDSASSVITQSSFAAGHNAVISNPIPAFSAVPGLTATAPGSVMSISPTPPMTPSHADVTPAMVKPPTSAVQGISSKREGGTSPNEQEPKKRRVAPTLVSTSAAPLKEPEKPRKS